MNSARFGNERGAALIIIVSVITVLTVIAMQFFYVSSVNRGLAINFKNMYQSELLAESAVNLVALQIALWKKSKSSITDAAGSATIPIDLNAPFCQQFPELMSTALLRMIFTEGGAEGMAAAAAGIKAKKEGGEESEISDVSIGGALLGISGFDKEKAEKFLKFEGEFSGVCSDEAAKFNLNAFYSDDPTKQVIAGLNEYDKRKQVLIRMLSRPMYKGLFPDGERDISEIVRNIADWVDSNNDINELGAVTRGNENSLYPPGVSDYKVKNAKFLTLSELGLVAGVDDSWLLPILSTDNLITVYGGDKVNICTASDDIAAALITEYANGSPSIPDIKPDDTKRIRLAVEAAKSACGVLTPNVNEIASAVDKVLLGAGTGEETDSESRGAVSNFADMITTESRFYKIIGTGSVGNTDINIIAVFDTNDANPKKWKLVYWRVE